MTPEERAHDPRAEVVLMKLLNPEPLYEVCPQCAVTSADVLDALAAAGLRVVAEGHAVIDGEVVALPPEEEYEDEPPCPRCGGEPGDTSLHTATCPTLGTCGQTEPDIDPPWHRDEEWWDGEERYSVAFYRHLAEAHGWGKGVPE